VGPCILAYSRRSHLSLLNLKCICSLHREVEVIQPLTESYWDPEKYCLTYNKDGNTYELYDEQQILYPVCLCIVVLYVFCGHTGKE